METTFLFSGALPPLSGLDSCRERNLPPDVHRSSPFRAESGIHCATRSLSGEGDAQKPLKTFWGYWCICRDLETERMIEEEFPHVKKKMKKMGVRYRGGVGEGAHLPPSGKGGAPPSRMPAGHEGSFTKSYFHAPAPDRAFPCPPMILHHKDTYHCRCPDNVLGEMELTRGIKQQIGAGIELLACPPQHNDNRHTRKRQQTQRGIAKAGIFTAEISSSRKEPLHVVAVLPGKLIQRQDMGTNCKDLAGLQIRRPDQFSGKGYVSGARKIPEDRQLREISEPVEKGGRDRGKRSYFSPGRADEDLLAKASQCVRICGRDKPGVGISANLLRVVHALSVPPAISIIPQ